MKIGYARTSTIEQEAGFEAQVKELNGIGCEKIFSEKTSSAAKRQNLEDVLDFIREGDTLVITKLDRLARSVAHLGEIIERLETKRANLQILELGIDTGKATGKLVLNVMGAIAQFERETMLERQRIGIAKAKADGKYKGRKPTARAKANEVRALFKEGLSALDIADRLNIGTSSVYRLLAK